MYKIKKGSNPNDISKECNSKWEFYVKKIPAKAMLMEKPFMVETLEGDMEGKAGDYLSIGPEGEFYPIDKDVLDKSYEKIDMSVECSKVKKESCKKVKEEDDNVEPDNPMRKRIRDPEKCDKLKEDACKIVDDYLDELFF